MNKWQGVTDQRNINVGENECPNEFSPSVPIPKLFMAIIRLIINFTEAIGSISIMMM